MKLKLADCLVDLDARTALRESTKVRLSSTEARLLRYLASRPKETISRDELYEQVWKYSSSLQTRTLDLAMFRLRKKVEAHPREPQHLLTSYGTGYTFVPLGHTTEILSTEGAPEGKLTNLTPEANTFIGRSEELKKLTELVGSPSRCVSVLGSPGTGKTRLVKRWAQERLTEGTVSSAWFCDLADARSSLDVLEAVARAMNLKLSGKDDNEVIFGHQIGYEIARLNNTLIVLDNGEQVIETIANYLKSWYAQAPNALFVVTSQVPTGLPMEQRFPLEPLPLPGDEESMPDNPCVRLFIDRARQVRPDFEHSPANARFLLAIMAQMDGLPLAIEFAASRMHLMTPEVLLKRLHQRFRLLRRPETAGPSRHTTLQAAIDWSWELLTPWEQSALAQCSVFRGGFDWEAVEAIVHVDGWDEAPWSIDVVSELVERSLIMVTEIPGGGVRLRLLQSIAAYADEKLGNLSDVKAAGVHQRHSAYYAYLGSPSRKKSLYGTRAQIHILAREQENLKRAIDQCLENDWDEYGFRAATGSLQCTRLAGPFAQGIALGLRVLTHFPHSVHRAPLLEMVGLLERVSGKMEDAKQHFAEALTVRKNAGDRNGECVVYGNLAQIHEYQGEMEKAMECYQHALRLSQDTQNTRLEGSVLACIGDLLAKQGENQKALDRYYPQALAKSRENGNALGEGVVLCNMGNVLLRLNQPDVAEKYIREALAVAESLGAQESKGVALSNLAAVYLHRKEYSEADAHLDQAEQLFRDINSPRRLGLLMCLRGRQALALDNRPAAMSALADAERAAEPLGVGSRSQLGQDIIALREALDLHTTESQPDANPVKE